MTTARDIMTTEVVTLKPDLPLDEMERALRAAGISGAPVADEGVLMGIVSRSDVARLLSVEEAYLEHAMEAYETAETGGGELASIADQLGHRLREMTVSDAMIREVDTVDEGTPLKTLAAKMLKSHHRRLIVTAADGSIAGIVTATDVVRVVAGATA